jgi:hypothetical protein
MANASIVLSFVKPDDTVNDVQVTTYEKGVFSFTYSPDVAGNWTVVLGGSQTKDTALLLTVKMLLWK